MKKKIKLNITLTTLTIIAVLLFFFSCASQVDVSGGSNTGGGGNTGPVALNLRNTQNSALADISKLELVEIGGNDFVIASSMLNGRFDVMKPDANGSLSSVANRENQPGTAGRELDLVRATEVVAKDGGNTYLYAAGFRSSIGGITTVGNVGGGSTQKLSYYQIANDGSLSSDADFSGTGNLTASLFGVWDMASVKIDDSGTVRDFLFTAAILGDSIGSYTVAANGSLSAANQILNSSTTNTRLPRGYLDGVNSLAVAVTNGNSFLFTGSYLSDAVASFSINNTSGNLTFVDGENDSTKLDRITDIEVAEINSTNYLFAGSYKGGVTVFEINNSGNLSEAVHVDSSETRLNGITGLSVITVGSSYYLLASSYYGDGISSYAIDTSSGISLTKDTSLNTTMLNGSTSLVSLDNTGGSIFASSFSSGNINTLTAEQ